MHFKIYEQDQFHAQLSWAWKLHENSMDKISDISLFSILYSLFLGTQKKCLCDIYLNLRVRKFLNINNNFKL